MVKIQLLPGQKFGRLTLIKETSKTKSGHYQGLFSCECGVEVEKRTTHVASGAIKSCGCLNSESSKNRMKTNNSRFKHGLCRLGTPIITTYRSMKCRCLNPNTPGFHRYGGRGISICEEWANDPHTFYTWAIENGYEQGLQIDRINNDGNYEPSNCRFVTSYDNMRNTSRNIWIEYQGEKMVLKDLSIKTGVPGQTLWRRIKNGFSVEESISMGCGSPKKKSAIFT